MSKYASKVVKQAQSWIGRNEADGSHEYIIDIYNEHKPLAQNYKVSYYDSWCATFVSSVSIKLGYTDIIPTECSCQRMIELFKKKNSWVENENVTPKIGWVIFYDWQDNGSGDNKGWSDHVGIVEKVYGDKITVIEGNKSDAVGRRTIKVNGKNIRGYGVPKYDAETTLKGVQTVAEEVLTGKWGNGKVRKEKLENAGYNYAEVQAMVNQLLKSDYYSKYTGTAYFIDVVFKEIGVPEKFRGSWAARKPVATANGIVNYTGTTTQNTKLVNLAKQGKLKRVL